MLNHIDHVVIGIPVNQLVVGINARQGRLLVDDNHKGLALVGEFFFFEIQRFLLILFSAENTDLDVIGEGHRSFRAVPVGLHLAGLNLERDLVFTVAMQVCGC